VIVFDLLAFGLSANGTRHPEIEIRPLDRRDKAGRNEFIVHRRKSPGIDFEAMIERIARAAIIEVEIGMLGEIAEGWLVRDGV
jgi:hypothetical protein